MTKRVAAAMIASLLFSCLALLGAYNAHQLFSRQLFFSCSIGVCLYGLTVPAIRTWFFLLESCVLLLVMWMAFGREYIRYKSKMLHICPGIDTPRAEGQGQYGTARWLTRQELKTAFTVIEMDVGTPKLQELICHGRDDLEGCG